MPDEAKRKAAYFAYSVISGSAFLFTKIAKHAFPGLTLACLRLSIGAFLLTMINLLLVLAVRQHKEGRRSAVPSMVPRERAWVSLHEYSEFRLTKQGMWKLVFMGLFNCAIPYSLYPYIVGSVNIGVMAIIAGSGPIFAQLLERALIHSSQRKSELRFSTACGFVLAFIGIVGICSEKVISSRSFDWNSMGMYLLMVVAVLSKASASLFAQQHMAGFPVLWISWGQTTCGAVITLVSAALGDYVIAPHPYKFDNVSSSALWGILYLGICSSCIVYLIQFWLIRAFGSVKQMFVDFLVPIVGVVEGVIFLNEWHDAPVWQISLQVGGFVFICSGIALLLYSKPTNQVPLKSISSPIVEGENYNSVVYRPLE